MTLALVVLAVGLTAARSVKRYDDPQTAAFDSSRQGQFDFHNGIYFPAVAYLDGISPYGQQFADEYPVTRPLPLMSPLVVLLHAPLALLRVRTAEILYFGINMLLLAAIAWLSVNWIPDRTARSVWFLIALLLVVASRAGHTTLLTGYLTAEMVGGALLALATAQTRPWLSAIGVAITSCKPTYAIPLFLLMIARGDQRAAWRGLGLSIAGAVIALTPLLLHEAPQQFWQDLQHGQAAHMADSYELPVNTWTRIDLLAVIAKWMNWAPSEPAHLAVMVLLLPLPALALWRLRRIDSDHFPAGLSSGIIAVSMLATLYHHVYDALLLFPAIAGLALGEASTRRWSRAVRLLIAGLLLFVAWNYPSSELAVKLTGISGTQLRLLTSTGPIALSTAWVAICLLPFLPRARRAKRHP